MIIDIETQKKVLSLLNKIDSERMKNPDKALYLKLGNCRPGLILPTSYIGIPSREAMLFEKLMMLFGVYGELCMIDTIETITTLIINLKTVD